MTGLRIMVMAVLFHACIGIAKAQDAGHGSVISSQTAVYDVVEKAAIFMLDVSVTHSNVNIFADRMMVFFDDSNSVKRVTAEGNVIITQRDAERRVGRGTTADYIVEDGEIVLTGNPMIIEGEHVMTAGKRMVFRLDNKNKDLGGEE